MRFALLPLAALSAFALACDGTASVTIPVGLSFEVDSSAVQLPEELRDNSDGTPVVASVACGPGGLCPTSAEIPVSCVADLCNPDGLALEVSLGGPVNLEDEVGPFLSVLDTVEVLEVTYVVTTDTSTLPIDQIELFWGPPGSQIGDADVFLLGTFPMLGGGAPAEGSLSLSAAGQRELTAYVETGARQLQFFGRVAVDIEPGDPFPTAGTLWADVVVRVKASGTLL